MIAHVYTCEGCRSRTTFRMPEAVVPFRRWVLTCRHCRRYEVHTLVARRGARVR